MIRALVFLICCFSLAVVHNKAQAEILQVNSTSGMPQDEFIVEALKLALKHSGKDYSLQGAAERLSDARSHEDLKNGNLDVYWSMTSTELETKFRPIRIPVFKGLFGHRLLLIRNGDQSRFNNIRDLNGLQRFNAGQGTLWPDTKILQGNAIPVKTTMQYEHLFYMLEGGRFDYYPRSVLEPWSEIVTYSKLDLTVEEKLLLIYRAPLYFFVAKGNQTLAQDIETGLEQAIADGSYDELFFNHPVIKSALAQAKIKQRRVINLTNPLLPSQTPVSRKELWLDINSL